jgi:hypothetical protein
MPYKATVHEAVSAYYRAELGGFECEYLELLLEVVQDKINYCEQILSDFPTENTEFVADYRLYGRIKDRIIILLENKQLNKQ